MISCMHLCYFIFVSLCRSNDADDLGYAVNSYYDFLGNASEWLSHRATDVIYISFSQWDPLL